MKSVQKSSKVVPATIITSDLKINNLDFGMPYKRLNDNINLLNTYFKNVPKEFHSNSKYQSNKKQIDELLRKYARKPNLCLYGNFDSGKSTLANVLIGENILPTNLSPWTRLPTFLHHIDDKPYWMGSNDNSWIFNKDWNPTFWMNEEHCRQHLIECGNYNILDKYVTHNSMLNKLKIHKNVKESFALVFINSPILHTCSLVDFPGFGNSDEDTQKAMNEFLTIDSVMYLSTIAGFMDSSDMHYLGTILDKLPLYEEIYSDFTTFGQLFILATHCYPDKNEDEINYALQVGAERIYNLFKDTKFKRISKLLNRNIRVEHIFDRMGSCWLGKKDRYETVSNNLHRLLSIELPKFWYNKIDNGISEFKDKSCEGLRKIINEYEMHLTDLNKIDSYYSKLLEEEDQRKRDFKEKKDEINNTIDKFKDQTISDFEDYYNETIEKENIINIIDTKFPDKKEAKEYLANYILENIQEIMKKSIEPKTYFICEKTKMYLEQYKEAQIIDNGTIDLTLGFDEVAAFSSKVLTLSSLGAMSSLGLYLGGSWIAANSVGIIATIGTGMAGVGGALLGAIGAFFSTVTGPIALGIIAAIAIFSIFKSWKKELSKKIIESFEKNKVKEKIIEAITEYWEDTKNAFNIGAEEVENKWQEMLKNKLKESKERLLSRDEIKSLLEEANTLQTFFTNLPWSK